MSKVSKNSLYVEDKIVSVSKQLTKKMCSICLDTRNPQTENVPHLLVVGNVLWCSLLHMMVLLLLSVCQHSHESIEHIVCRQYVCTFYAVALRRHFHGTACSQAKLPEGPMGQDRCFEIFGDLLYMKNQHFVQTDICCLKVSKLSYCILCSKSILPLCPSFDNCHKYTCERKRQTTISFLSSMTFLISFNSSVWPESADNQICEVFLNFEIQGENQGPLNCKRFSFKFLLKRCTL